VTETQWRAERLAIKARIAWRLFVRSHNLRHRDAFARFAVEHSRLANRETA